MTPDNPEFNATQTQTFKMIKFDKNLCHSELYHDIIKRFLCFDFLWLNQTSLWKKKGV